MVIFRKKVKADIIMFQRTEEITKEEITKEEITKGTEQRKEEKKKVNETIKTIDKTKFIDILNIIAKIGIAIALIYIPEIYSDSINKREINIKTIKIATDILRDEEREDNKLIRRWAVKVINKYSEIKLSEEEKQELIKSGIKGTSPLTQPITSYTKVVRGKITCKRDNNCKKHLNDYKQHKKYNASGALSYYKAAEQENCCMEDFKEDL